MASRAAVLLGSTMGSRFDAFFHRRSPLLADWFEIQLQHEKFGFQRGCRFFLPDQEGTVPHDGVPEICGDGGEVDEINRIHTGSFDDIRGESVEHPTSIVRCGVVEGNRDIQIVEPRRGVVREEPEQYPEGDGMAFEAGG